MDILNALANIGFDWRVTVANIVNFALVYFVLNKLVFSPLASILSERKSKIESGLKMADDAAVLKERALQEREEVLREARMEASSLILAAREKESEIISGASAKAEIEAVNIIEEAKKRSVAEHASMLSDFKSEAVELVVIATEKLTKKKLEDSENYDLARQYISELKVKPK